MRSRLLFALFAAFLPIYAMDDETAAAAPSPDETAPTPTSATAEPAAEGNAAAPAAADASSADGQKASSDAESASSTSVGFGDAPNADASPAASTSESDTSSSAQSALPAVDTSVADTSHGEAAADVDPTPAVHIDIEDHAEAKDRFAGLMARLHKFEDEAVAELKEDLRAIATLLHLHSVASGTAEVTGDYKSSDL